MIYLAGGKGSGISGAISKSKTAGATAFCINLLPFPQPVRPIEVQIASVHEDGCLVPKHHFSPAKGEAAKAA
jgi:hypothetical protein